MDLLFLWYTKNRGDIMNKPTKFIYAKEKSIEVEKGYIVDNYIQKEHGLNYSVVRTHLDGSHPYMKNLVSDRTYYLISGQAEFVFEEDCISLHSGEMLVIPKNVKYSFSGKFDAILIDSPAFEPHNDIIYR